MVLLTVVSGFFSVIAVTNLYWFSILSYHWCFWETNKQNKCCTNKDFRIITRQRNHSDWHRTAEPCTSVPVHQRYLLLNSKISLVIQLLDLVFIHEKCKWISPASMFFCVGLVLLWQQFSSCCIRAAIHWCDREESNEKIPSDEWNCVWKSYGACRS